MKKLFTTTCLAALFVIPFAFAACDESHGNAADGEDMDSPADTVAEEEVCTMPSALDPDIEIPNRGELTIHDCLLDMACVETMVCAHRGFHTFAPENTLSAIMAAAEIGVDAVEMDIRETLDDVLVVMHDDTVDRTTDGTGSVGEMTFDEIRGLRIDTSRLPDYTGEVFVPTFLEAIEEARGKMVVYVDMKTSRDDLLVSDIQEAEAWDFVMIYSGSLEKLERVQAADPDIFVFPVAESTEEVDAIMASVTPVLIELGGSIDAALVDYIHAAGVKVSRDSLGGADIAAKYECDPTHWDVYVDAGINLIQTNWPEYMLPYIKNR